MNDSNQQEQQSGVEHIDKEWAATHSADLLKLLEQERAAHAETRARLEAAEQKLAHLGRMYGVSFDVGTADFQRLTLVEGALRRLIETAEDPKAIIAHRYAAIREAREVLAGQPAERTEER